MATPASTTVLGSMILRNEIQDASLADADESFTVSLSLCLLFHLPNIDYNETGWASFTRPEHG